MRIARRAVALGLLLGSAGLAVAATITMIDPVEGTVGTTIHVTGTDLGTKRPRAVLTVTGGGATFALKAKGPFDGASFNAVVLRIQPGVYDLTVTPRGGTPVTATGVFTARAPRVDSVDLASVVAGRPLTILGHFFGRARGRMRIGGRPARIRRWLENSITAIVHRRVAAGQAAIDVLGRGGTTQNAAQVGVIAPITGPNRVSATLGADHINSRGRFVTAVADATLHTFQFSGTQNTGSLYSPHVRTLIVPIALDLATSTFPYVTEVGGGALYTDTSLSPSAWSGDASNKIMVTINGIAGKRVTGTFHGQLKRDTGSGPDPIQVDGSFTVTAKTTP